MRPILAILLLALLLSAVAEGKPRAKNRQQTDDSSKSGTASDEQKSSAVSSQDTDVSESYSKTPSGDVDFGSSENSDQKSNSKYNDGTENAGNAEDDETTAAAGDYIKNKGTTKGKGKKIGHQKKTQDNRIKFCVDIDPTNNRQLKALVKALRSKCKRGTAVGSAAGTAACNESGGDTVASGDNGEDEGEDVVSADSGDSSEGDNGGDGTDSSEGDDGDGGSDDSDSSESDDGDGGSNDSDSSESDDGDGGSDIRVSSVGRTSI